MSCTTVSIAGIDTDIGKSIVTGLLASYLHKMGKTVTTLKLVQTGCKDVSEDILLHRKMMGIKQTPFDLQGTTCPYVFPKPASPALSARLVQQRIEAEVLDQATLQLQQAHEWLLVEGAGGLMVPLNEDLLLIDYLAEKKYPMILVTSPKLGSINHTRLSLEALKNRNVQVLGLVYNLYKATGGEIVQDTLAECKKALKDYGFPSHVLLLPDIRESMAVNWQILLNSLQTFDLA
ncbi:dethiobiotin synthase [Desulfogranum japonicum]|uniref:dethiobiotin synthase n=1 Tax=Desulfogranum japonicum TaxID=231447 RepID=UPI0004265193|nr:dethiobiotin synthase [Desulfogranum japonicum]